LSRSRWNIEQYFQRAKDDLGLDHYEGRSWRGFHHHLVMAVLATSSSSWSTSAAKKNFWCDVGTDAEQMRPWLLRWVGFCSCCRRQLEEMTLMAHNRVILGGGWPAEFEDMLGGQGGVRRFASSLAPFDLAFGVGCELHPTQNVKNSFSPLPTRSTRGAAGVLS